MGVGSRGGGTADAFLLTNKGLPKSSSRQESGALNVLSTWQGLMTDLHE